jgi:hypothetical protein
VTSDLVKQFLSVKAMADTQARGRAFETSSFPFSGRSFRGHEKPAFRSTTTDGPYRPDHVGDLSDRV